VIPIGDLDPTRRFAWITFAFITFMELPAIVVLGAWFVLQLFSGVGGLSTHASGGVAYWAHVGGFGFGMAVTWLFFRGRSDRAQPRIIAPRPDLF
jgi:membrane associated rhomboid family serine protease